MDKIFICVIIFILVFYDIKYIKRRDDMKRRGQIFPAILIGIIVLVIAGFAFIPSISKSIDNGSQKKCNSTSQLLLNTLSDKLNGTEENKLWYDLCYEQNSNRLLASLKEASGDEDLDISDYYVKFSASSVTILCKKHTDMLDKTLTIPDNLITDNEEYVKPASDIVVSITASGRDTYFQNSSLDKTDKEKKVFTNSDDTNELFPEIYVTAHFAGGGKRRLDKSEYKILVGELDMSKPQKTVLKIIYTKTAWPNDIFTNFNIDIIKNNSRPPLIVDGGNDGRYELAAWDWTNYVADAVGSPDGYMGFGASIVYFEGSYYYYPDGFIILSNNKNNGSLLGALNIDDTKKTAYCIEFDLDSPVYSNSIAQTIVHNGSLRLDNGLVYIWQDKPSKELDRGWIRVYCEMEQLN